MPRILILYQYFHPDDVVSAVHMSDLSEGLAARGWEVEAAPCNRSCRGPGQKFSGHELWRKVRIERVWRPAFRQSSGMGRVLNAAWMIGAWGMRSLKGSGVPDVVVIGTDPVLSVLAVPCWKFFHPRVAVAHWVHDLYPEAAIVDGLLREESWFVRFSRRLLRAAYRRCDAIVDIGPCMRRLLERYGPSGRLETLTPWALEEPPGPLPADAAERAALFGEARLGLLYSGNFGRAHSYEEILALARRLRGKGVSVAFSVRGNREDELRQAVLSSDVNVRFVPFAGRDQLALRLGAADVHVVTLRSEWTGAVVPSKFFGALAAGRPVLFAGSPDSSVARWIEEHRVGWVLTPDSAGIVEESLLRFADSPAVREQMFVRCHRVYQERFSKNAMVESWDPLLRSLVRD